jgi:hypothetical protein
MGACGHFSPLNCTFLHCSSKTTARKGFETIFCNEIKDLGANLHAPKDQKLKQKKHLQRGVQVIPEAKVGTGGKHKKAVMRAKRPA